MAKRKYEGSEIARQYGMTVREQRPGESDLAYYKSLAKQADQRLVRLERYSKEKNFYGLMQYAYANAMYDIRSLSGNPEARRFNQMPVKTASGAINIRNLQARINAVKRFLESPTSTKQGTVKVYKRRADTVNKKYGTNFSWQEMAAYYSNERNRALDSEYGSKTMVRVLGAMRRLGEDPEKIQKAIDGDIKISSDGIVNEIAKNLLSQGLTFSDLTSE